MSGRRMRIACEERSFRVYDGPRFEKDLVNARTLQMHTTRACSYVYTASIIYCNTGIYTVTLATVVVGTRTSENDEPRAALLFGAMTRHSTAPRRSARTSHRARPHSSGHSVHLYVTSLCIQSSHDTSPPPPAVATSPTPSLRLTMTSTKCTPQGDPTMHPQSECIGPRPAHACPQTNLSPLKTPPQAHTIF